MKDFDKPENIFNTSIYECGWRFDGGFRIGYELACGHDYHGVHLGELADCPHCGKPLIYLDDSEDEFKQQTFSSDRLIN